MIQDILPHRFDNSFYPRRVQDGDFILNFYDGQILLWRESEEEIILPTFRLLADVMGSDKLQYLFSIDDRGFYLYQEDMADVAPAAFQYEAMRDFRRIREDIPRVSAFAVMTGWHLYVWYQNHQFCGRCRTPLEHSEKERMLFCPACNHMIYPGIAPAVIIGVIHGDRILMSKYAGRDYKGYALLAGFAEIGETLEQTVAREVWEEVGLQVKNIRYYKSQPGGIDGNLLAGFFCDLEGDDTIRMDQEELAMAAWYHRDEIPVQNDGFSLTFEMIEYFKEHPGL